MAIVDRISRYEADLTAWRRHLHAHPETAFEEAGTAEFVAARLADFGVEVHRGLARTGVVGTLRGGRRSSRSIALRSDMDALPIQEKTGAAHASTAPGRMHACGHDGHIAMLLGAARYLAETRTFAGDVHFIFQPAEEGGGGGQVMVEEGLFDRFPADAVFGMHNRPYIPFGTFSLRPGIAMAACDVFTITVRGKGAHAATPHLAVDPIVAAAAIVGALQTIVSRNTSPLDNAVVSVTKLRAGEALGVIPDEAQIAGTVRTFRPDVQGRTEAAIRRVAAGVAASLGAAADLRYERLYPATMNSGAETRMAADAAEEIVGAAKVDRNCEPSMGSEDFSFMLQKRPGCYVGLGVGGTCLHSAQYDFNDAILTTGASYWARLAERFLAA